MKKTVFLIALTVLVVLFSQLDVAAQCAMCKATISENIRTGKGQGQGLNSGILYLMAFPYIIASVIAFFWYRAYRKNRQASLN